MNSSLKLRKPWYKSHSSKSCLTNLSNEIKTASYNFGKLGNYVNNLRVYATCNNVFTLTGYKGIDPEVNLGGLEPGMDMRYSNYPRTRSFMVGVNMNF